MGLLKKLFKKINEAESKERAKNEPTVEEFVKQINEKRIEEAMANGDERTAKYYESRMDKEYVRGERSIGEQNVELYALVRDQTASVEDVEAFCEKLMLETYAFKPLYEKYNDIPYAPPVFKEYSTYLANRGNYVKAAEVCAKALRWGVRKRWNKKWYGWKARSHGEESRGRNERGNRGRFTKVLQGVIWIPAKTS